MWVFIQNPAENLLRLPAVIACRTSRGFFKNRPVAVAVDESLKCLLCARKIPQVREQIAQQTPTFMQRWGQLLCVSQQVGRALQTALGPIGSCQIDHGMRK